MPHRLIKDAVGKVHKMGGYKFMHMKSFPNSPERAEEN